MTAKTPAKVHLRLRFQNLGKPRTAGLCGRAAGACDCGPLSCAFIERPSPLEKLSCKVRFFAQNRSRKYRQKVTVTTLFPTVSHCVFQLLAQMAHVCLHSESGYTLGFRRKIAHNGSHGETRGVSDGGGMTTLGPFRTFTNIPGPGIRTAYFAALGAWSRVLPKNAKSLRDSDALMRVAVPRRRGPAGLRDLFRFCRNSDLYAMRACARRGWYHYTIRRRATYYRASCHTYT